MLARFVTLRYVQVVKKSAYFAHVGITICGICAANLDGRCLVITRLQIAAFRAVVEVACDANLCWLNEQG